MGSTDLVALLKVCAKQKDLHTGTRIYADIVRMGLLEKDDVILGSALVSMFAKCGSLAKAEEVFDEFPVRDVVLWNTLIAGYVQQQHGQQALRCFEQLQLEGLSPDTCTYTCTLKACGNVGAAEKGKEIHTGIVHEKLLDQNLNLGNALIDMYAKCSLLAKAQGVFNELPVRDVVTWGALMGGYVQHGHGEQALMCFQQMQLEGLCADAFTFACILKACGSIGAAQKGKEIHAEIVREGLLEDVVLGTALVDMYAKSNMLKRAQEVFDKLTIRNVVSWNVLIAGYGEHGQGALVAECFRQMQLEGLPPDRVTYISILKAYSSIGAGDKVLELHEMMVREGLLPKDVVVANVLLDTCAKCGLLAKSQEVFNTLQNRDVFSWNALIAGYAQHGHGKQALNCFDIMQLEGVSPDAVTFVCMLKVCGSIGAIDEGKELHTRIVKEGLLEKDIVLGTVLVDMYIKFYMLSKAQEVFDKLPIRNIVSWNVLMAGYVDYGHSEQALKCFQCLHHDGLVPTAVTFVYILRACGSAGAADKGKEIHAKIVREGLLEKDVVVGTSLLDMYAKCGLLAKAQEVFEKLPVQNAVLWNALMGGYALFGKGRHVLYLCDKMIRGGVKPDLVTFIAMFKAYSHEGLLDEAHILFVIMDTGYDVLPTLEHYTCIVDLFARAGNIEKAMAVIKEMPFTADSTVWLIILDACQKRGDIKLGTVAFEHAIEMDRREDNFYVYMRNIYAAAGRQDDADQVEAMRLKYAS